MVKRTGSILVAIGLLMGPAAPSAHAEEKVLQLALQGSLGFGQVWDDESMLGAAVGPEASVEVRVLGRLGVQLGVSRLWHHRDFGYPSDVRFSGNTLMYGADLLYHFRGTRVRPFLLAGVTRFRTRSRNSSPEYAYNGIELVWPLQEIGEEVFDSTEDGQAWSFGGGVEVPLSPSLAIRSEARFVFLRKISGSVGFSYRF